MVSVIEKMQLDVSAVTHKTSVEIVITLPKTTCDLGEMLSSTLAIQKRTNRDYILKVAQNVRFLARQGILLRGDGGEADSITLCSYYICVGWMIQRSDKYTSPQIQNELIKLWLYIFLETLLHSYRMPSSFLSWLTRLPMPQTRSRL